MNPLRNPCLIEAERRISDSQSLAALSDAEETGAAVIATLYAVGCLNKDEAEHARHYLMTSARTVRITLMQRSAA